MKTYSEKEKKLDNALNKLIDLNLNTNLKENLQHLSYEKNQLEIEKKEILNKYNELVNEHEKIKQELKSLKHKENDDFSLYINISKNAKNSLPMDIITNEFFSEYRVKKKSFPTKSCYSLSSESSEEKDKQSHGKKKGKPHQKRKRM